MRFRSKVCEVAALSTCLFAAGGSLAIAQKHPPRAELRVGHSDVLLTAGKLAGTVAVRNSGASSGPTNLELTYRLRARTTRRHLKSFGVPAIRAGQRATVHVSVPFGSHSTGVYVIEACADTSHKVLESKETDNCKHVALITVLATGAAAVQLPDADNDGVEDDADNAPNDPNDTTMDDDTPPDTFIDLAPPLTGAVSDTPVTVRFHASETDADFECRVDGGLWAGCVSPYTFGPLGGGPHSFDVRGRDFAGNADPTPAHTAWTTLDQTPPDTIIDSGPGDTNGSHSASFTFHSTDPGSTFECRLDTRTWEPCSSPDNDILGVADGQNRFEVRATDPAGNLDGSPAEYYWNVAPGG